MPIIFLILAFRAARLVRGACLGQRWPSLLALSIAALAIAGCSEKAPTKDEILSRANEAFAAQALACAAALDLDLNKLNVNGGAVALSHPLGASGSRITGHLVHEMKRKGLKKAIGSACIGGGQGIALLLESV